MKNIFFFSLTLLCFGCSGLRQLIDESDDELKELEKGKTFQLKIKEIPAKPPMRIPYEYTNYT